MIGILTIALASLIFLPKPVFSDDLMKGLEAYNKNEFATALKKLRPVAEQGNSTAQNYMGWMYDAGLGIAEDDKEAVRWYRLAAAQGFAHAQFNLGG